MPVSRHSSNRSASLLLAASFLLAGCAANYQDSAVKDVSSAAIQGTAFGGQQPVTGATVTVWEAGASYGAGATQLASTTTDKFGSFAFAANAYTCDFDNAPVYITASGGDPGSGVNANLVLAAGLGSCASAHNQFINLNEVTTAATAFALSHFFTTKLGGDYTTDLIGGDAAVAGVYNAGLTMANTYTIPALVNLSQGTVNPNTPTATIESAKLYSIANILATCVNSQGLTAPGDVASLCGQLFTLTTPPGGSRPSDTLQAAVQMALFPYQNVSDLFDLTPPASPFSGLGSAPNDWTLGIAYTSPTLGLGINGTATSGTSTNIDIDAQGRVWFPSTAASAHGIAYFDPTTYTFNGPYATSLVHPQYLAISNQGDVFASDLAGSTIYGVASTAPASATLQTSFATTGFSGPILATNYATTPTPTDAILYTGGGTASTLGSTLYQELSGTITNPLTFDQPPNALSTYASGTLFVNAATSGSSTACNYETNYSGGSTIYIQASSSSTCVAGGMANTTNADNGVMTASTVNQLCDYGAGVGNDNGECFSTIVPLATPEAIALDGDSNVWIANSANASVSTLGYGYKVGNYTDFFETSNIPYIHDGANGNTLTAPYGIAIDRSGNVWVSNAGCVSTNGSACAPGSFVLSELVGAAAPTITPLAAQRFTNKQGTRPQLARHTAAGRPR